MKDHSKCDKCHEERVMGLERVLRRWGGGGWRWAVRAEGWGRNFQACAGGGHSKFTGSMAGWSMAHRWGWWRAAGPKQGSPVQNGPKESVSNIVPKCANDRLLKKSKSNPGERIQSPSPHLPPPLPSPPLCCPSCPPS